MNIYTAEKRILQFINYTTDREDIYSYVLSIKEELKRYGLNLPKYYRRFLDERWYLSKEGNDGREDEQGQGIELREKDCTGASEILS